MRSIKSRKPHQSHPVNCILKLKKISLELLFSSQNLPICRIGILRLEIETNIEKQYFLQNSRAFQERDFLKNVFNNSEDNFHIYSLADYGYFE
jgi:predicted RND superfamily exporter protein